MSTNLRSQCPSCSEIFVRDGTGETLAEKNAYWALREHMAAAHPDDCFACPRQSGGITAKPGEKAAHWDADGTCSYCGSFSQDQFFAAVEAGAEVGPTDKNYKVYLKGPGVPAVHGAAKFYYQHLDEAGRDRFIEIFNAKKMTIGYPGHFYVLPFFCTPAEPAV